MTIEENAISLCAMGYSIQEISNMTNMFIACPQTSSGSIMLNLDLPSITIPNLKDEVVITRTVTTVDASKDAPYNANVKATSGVSVSVSPQSLSFNATTSELTFQVQFKVA
ncbi:hypothetical protein MRB53_019517 [Persea americana]|uniref:Uncharacterized protein n=1 Tax=Persea americana TaxID=3435 RepID=A0ACC2KYV7_PERAE|nr:hypothetical protein MRB53_019517 [Persea americana]